MSWVRMDDGWTEHPKLVTAGPMAALLWAAGLAWLESLDFGPLPEALE